MLEPPLDDRGPQLGGARVQQARLPHQPGDRWRARLPPHQVHVADVSGRRRIVDRGAGIEPRSLELTPDRRAIVYTKDAERRALPLD
jgi:hypothetical protein